MPDTTIGGANITHSRTIDANDRTDGSTDVTPKRELSRRAFITTTAGSLLTLPAIEATAATSRVLGDAPKMLEEYDYVFIGAGATGATASRDLLALFDRAADLMKQGFKVCVLESGEFIPTTEEKIPAAHVRASDDPRLLANPNNDPKGGTGYRVQHFSTIEDRNRDPKHLEDGNIHMPRGAVGSSRMNAMILRRAHDSDWEKRAIDSGDPAWRTKNMNKYWDELTRDADPFGPNFLRDLGRDKRFATIEVSTADPRLLFEDAQFKQVALRGIKWTLDNVGSTGDRLKRLGAGLNPNADATQGTEGAVSIQMSINNDGQRDGSLNMLLGAKERWSDQLTIRYGAKAKKLTFDGDRCTGLIWVDKDGVERTIKVRREAVAACGAAETAKLLMLSGMAPAKKSGDLAAAGIEHTQILEGVGEKIGDRYEVPVIVRMKEPFKLVERLKAALEPLDTNNADYQKWAKGRGGILAVSAGAPAFQMRSRPELPDPDLFIFAVPGYFPGYKPGYSTELLKDPNLLTFLVLDANKGEMKGELRINVANPPGAPIINKHHHHERTGIGTGGTGPNAEPSPDSLPCALGVMKVRQLIEEAYGDMVERDAQGHPLEVSPLAGARTLKELQLAVEACSWGHHIRGGAQTGHANDPFTVVDSSFRVIGKTGLRVIDASVLPDNVSDFIVGPLYTMAKMASRKIAEDALTGPRPAARFNPVSIRCDAAPETFDAARAQTLKHAEAAKQKKLISQGDFEKITQKKFQGLLTGTVDKRDMEIAWKAIELALRRDNNVFNGDNHVLAHNLLWSIAQQLDLQERGKRTAGFATLPFLDRVAAIVQDR